MNDSQSDRDILRVVPTGAALGADVEGIDLSRPLVASTFAAISQAWADHLVLRFRRQRLGDADLVRFSGRFGDLDHCPPNELGRLHIPETPEITVISNVVEDGRPIGSLGNAEARWHTDMSYLEAPPRASLLYALEVPPQGGDTSFCNMYRAYATLPAAVRERIAGLSAVHDATLNSAGVPRQGMPAVTDVTQTPGAHHPLVRRHPVTGQPALFLGRRTNAWIVGLPVAESDALLDFLWAHAARPEFAWTHVWQVGDLVLWDNRCTMHCPTPLPDGVRRVMYRTTVKGCVPV